MEKITRNLVNEENSVYFPRGADWKWVSGIFHYTERIADSVDRSRERVNYYELLPNALLLATYNAVLCTPALAILKFGPSLLEKIVE